MKYLILSSLFVISGCTTAYLKQGPPKTIEWKNSKFEYQFLRSESDPKKQKIELKHTDKVYTGELANLTFRDRYSETLKLVGKIIKTSCENGVADFGNIVLSQDPEINLNDPNVEQLQHLTLSYSCK